MDFKNDGFCYQKYFINISLFIFSSSFLISFTKLLLNFNGDILCLDTLVHLLASNTVGLGVVSDVGSSKDDQKFAANLDYLSLYLFHMHMFLLNWLIAFFYHY